MRYAASLRQVLDKSEKECTPTIQKPYKAAKVSVINEGLSCINPSTALLPKPSQPSPSIPLSRTRQHGQARARTCEGQTRGAGERSRCCCCACPEKNPGPGELLPQPH